MNHASRSRPSPTTAALVQAATVLRRKILPVPVMLIRNGPLQLLRLTYVCSILPIATPLLIRSMALFLRSYSAAKRLLDKYLFAERELHHWRRRREELLREGASGYRTGIDDLGLSPEYRETLRQLQDRAPNVVV